jgi:uncharacterized protein YlxW (UPF0749 family)
MAELVFRAESGRREEESKKLKEVLNEVSLKKKVTELEAQINNLEGQITAYQDCIEKILRKG